MHALIDFFNIILYQPLLNGLILIYEYIPGHDFGVAIIILTILIKLALYPFGSQSVKSQKVLSELQPKIKEIQKKYKDDKEKQTKELMALYKENKVNPFSGCLPLLIQFPILIALYRVFWNGFQVEKMSLLYGFVKNPGLINTLFLGIVDLSKPNFVLAILAGILQYFQTKMVMPKQGQDNKKKEGISGAMQKQMVYLMPVFTVIILFKLPSAIGLYWVVVTLFTIGQQYLVLQNKKLS